MFAKTLKHTKALELILGLWGQEPLSNHPMNPDLVERMAKDLEQYSMRIWMVQHFRNIQQSLQQSKLILMNLKSGDLGNPAHLFSREDQLVLAETLEHTQEMLDFLQTYMALPTQKADYDDPDLPEKKESHGSPS